MANKLQFKVSSALKNIIGSDLINDDFIAVFELVKNSYDAHATKVTITFRDIYGDDPKIIIKDNGKGMNYDDLVNKWLFVAYSAKTDGTEEDSYNYRDKINVKRAYAGAKGIGRFSCDRLGSYLYLETTKDEPNPTTEVLMTDWEKFETDLKDEFINIDVEHESLTHKELPANGTLLEISNLKSNWDRRKLLKLKDALAKLINPNTHNEEGSFQITLYVDEEKVLDKEHKNYRKIVNGKIKNLIFETLDLKTTKIVSSVSNNDDNRITTSLYEGGKLVYSIVEENSHKSLYNIDLVLYYMNTSAKQTFARRMGVNKVNYGHVFVYKNGIRIYPYGEYGGDPLNMDVRKGQGHSRYLGTREVIGYISINEPNKSLQETSSRGDGLKKTDSYQSMVEWFYTSLRRVEKYIIDIVDWGNDLSNEDYIKLDSDEKKLSLEKLIKNLTRSKNIIDFQLAPEIFEILDKKTGKSVKKSLSKISDSVKSNDFDKKEVLREIKSAEEKLQKLQNIKEESEDEALEKLIENELLNQDLEEKLIENENLSQSLEDEQKRGAFQGALIGTDKERIIGLQHQIFHSSSRINRNIKLLLRHLSKTSIDKKTEKYIRFISLESSKINSIANFITKANFNFKATEIKEDIVSFITGYLNEIYIYEDRIIDTDLNILINNLENNKYIIGFKPLEITTIIDNFISNSEKKTVSATKITFEFKRVDSNLEIIITDNGKGIEESDLSQVFNFGFTRTNGSGIGLYQAHDLITNSLKGSIDVTSILGQSTTFRITI